ncbi:bifunctional metallophosphatase/5'-nucleotidase [Limosilactobacillus sp. STM2_1]|uniref:Bifunctional metallophosphatase/5'-nucleotidase n=1 Tax=Limosilactobacillus rudii TaxID=2759755 RepID=A0A7W3UL65_9LACO|nr:bifunctional metallophosphatase/5'-nucleotidase [Limosilactobacillus rudii]MBB1078800.1 bifunctional metallophosphatase/5'-nucleotidase [Limosilactobacillus rudii]MBB1097648.1 bifunctional metallophosphatase/5'-nucleotidase [Limosilactobacillus rudii]MCD7134757.1 bifunctional metallophosphatase/5'-nucleotidase [Limosilactobacillus rudii]
MKHNGSKYTLLLGTTLLGLYFQASGVHAATTDSVTNNQQSVNGNVTPMVQTNKDEASTPQTTTDWSDPAKYQQDIPVQILGINDLHGGLETTGSATIGNKTYNNTGTAARLAGHLDAAEESFKAANPTGTTIRVEAGDMVGASPANSALLQDESTMHALKAMDFKVGTLGNHEFDEGLAEYMRIVNGGQPTKQYNEAEMVYPHVNSGINIITANVVQKSDGQIPFGMQPYLIKEIHTSDGKVAKIGFIGIETTSLPILTLYDNYKDYDVLDEATTIAKYDKILRNKGVNAIVVLAHTGVATDKDGNTKGNAVDIIKKLYQIDPENSVDLYVAGHSHQYANATVGSVKLVQAIYTGKAYDDVIGYIDPSTNDFAKNSIVSHVFPVLSAEDAPNVKTDANVTAIVQDADRRVAPIINKKIGEAAKAGDILGRLHNTPTRENAAGELVVDGQLYAAKKAGLPADFAMTNTGGVRADLHVNEDRSITWGSAQAVQPFGNILRVVQMTGSQIVDALNQQYDEDQAYYLQVAGLHYTYTDQNDPNQPYKVVKVYDQNNQPLDLNKNYNVVINDFLAGGGDGFSAFKNTKVVGIIGQDTDAFINYITDMTNEGKLITAPVMNRKIYMTAEQLVSEDAVNSSVDNNQDATLVTGTTNKEMDQPTTPTVVLPTTAGQPAKVIQLTTQTVAKANANRADVNSQFVNLTPMMLDKASVTHQTTDDSKQAMLPQTGDDDDLTWLLLGTSLMSAIGLTIINRKRKQA